MWTIYQINGLSHVVNTQYAQYGNVSTHGVYTVLLDLYCTNRTSGSVRATDDIYIDDRTSGIASSSEAIKELILYPNPFSKKLSVQVEQNSLIKIADISGKEVYNNIVINAGTFEISTEYLNAGVYFITVTNNKTTITKKVVKN
jgi:hypothetical protein